MIQFQTANVLNVDIRPAYARRIKCGGIRVITTIDNIEQELDPFPFYRAMRESNPVYYDPARQSWNVFRYDDVQQVLSDYKAFSSQFRSGGVADADQPFAASIISTDPPRHRQLRNLVTQAFTPRAVDALAPRISYLVNDYLDQVTAHGQMDVIHDLGYPLPVTVIAELLGVPAADREQFKKWSDAVVSTAGSGEDVDYEAFASNGAVMEMSTYFFNMIEQRTAQPGEDLISGLLAANIEGEHLNLMELLGFCVLLLVAGNETTTNLIGNALLTFTEHPEAWARLRANPELVPQAIEEVLRYRSPVQSMYRVATREVKLNGGTIPQGGWVVAWIGSANHDDAQFARPEQFDIERTPNKNLAFGHGIHYCLGAPLARLEGKIALSAMLERFSTVALAPNAELKRLPSTIVYGFKSVPITFTLT